jgi:F0F1-type ATP synthase assembly protein I
MYMNDEDKQLNMRKIKYSALPDIDKSCADFAIKKSRHDFIRRTRTLCLHSTDRPGIYSKNLVKVVVSCASLEHPIEGVFCVDAEGSRKGSLVAHKSHFKGLPDGAEIDIEIFEATPRDCVEWLRGNDDPERKSLGEILNFALDGAEEAKRISKISEENFKQAKQDRIVAAQDKKKGMLYGVAGFLGGVIFDVGMIEDKLDYKIPLGFIIFLFLVMIASIFIAFKIIGKKNHNKSLSS